MEPQYICQGVKESSYFTICTLWKNVRPEDDEFLLPNDSYILYKLGDE